MLRPVVSGKRGLDFILRGAAAEVPVSRKEGRIGNPGHDVAKDAQAGNAADVADHEMKLQVHLHEGLLHALNTGARRLNQGLAVSHVAAQRRDVRSRSEASAKQANAVKLLKPLGVRDIAFAAGHVLDVPRVHEEHLESAGLQDLEHRDPIDAGRFHGDGLDAATDQPLRQPVQVCSERLE